MSQYRRLIRASRTIRLALPRATTPRHRLRASTCRPHIIQFETSLPLTGRGLIDRYVKFSPCQSTPFTPLGQTHATRVNQIVYFLFVLLNPFFWKGENLFSFRGENPSEGLYSLCMPLGVVGTTVLPQCMNTHRVWVIPVKDSTIRNWFINC